MVLVWTRPRFSVGGMRCQRWPPASSRNAAAAPEPSARKTIRPRRRSTSSRLKTVAERAFRVNRELFLDQGLGVVAAFGGADLDNHGHGFLLRDSVLGNDNVRQTDAFAAKCADGRKRGRSQTPT